MGDIKGAALYAAPFNMRFICFLVVGEGLNRFVLDMPVFPD